MTGNSKPKCDGGYRRESRISLEYGNTGMVRGPIGLVESPSPTAIGFCPRCHTNARRTTTIRGVFNCTGCTYQWMDSRVGKQPKSFDDYFSTS